MQKKKIIKLDDYRKPSESEEKYETTKIMHVFFEDQELINKIDHHKILNDIRNNHKTAKISLFHRNPDEYIPDYKTMVKRSQNNNIIPIELHKIIFTNNKNKKYKLEQII